MAKWITTYWAEDNGCSLVSDWLDGLPPAQYKSIAKKMLLLELCGNTLKMPHSKSLKEGLFELRDPSFGLRLYYCFRENKLIILLHGGDKKSQAKDIKMARTMIKKLEDKEKKQ
jgi:putative addiction module killer protein